MVTRRRFLKMGAAVSTLAYTQPGLLIPERQAAVAKVSGQHLASDWVITADKVIHYVGDPHDGPNPTYATVQQLHRMLQAAADDAMMEGDTVLDITDNNPSERITDQYIRLNEATLDDDSTQHLYGGSVVDAAGSQWDSIVNFGPNLDIDLQVDGIDGDWWNRSRDHMAPDPADTWTGITHQFMIPKQTDPVRVWSRETINYAGDDFVLRDGTYPGNSVTAVSSGFLRP